MDSLNFLEIWTIFNSGVFNNYLIMEMENLTVT